MGFLSLRKVFDVAGLSTFALNLWCNATTINDRAGQTGTSKFLEHALLDMLLMGIAGVEICEPLIIAPC